MMAQWKEHGTCVRMIWGQILFCTSQLCNLWSNHLNLSVLICNMGLIFPSSNGACRAQWNDVKLLEQCRSQEMDPEMIALCPLRCQLGHIISTNVKNLQLQWSSVNGHFHWLYDLSSPNPHYLETNPGINIFIFLFSSICLKFYIIKITKWGWQEIIYTICLGHSRTLTLPQDGEGLPKQSNNTNHS